MWIQSVHHVQLPFPVQRLPQIQHFYGDLLGLRDTAPAGAAALRFVAGSQRVDLVPQEGEHPAAPGAHLALEVLNLPELRHRLLESGLTLDETRPLPGYRRFFVLDPAGNRLEFVEPEPDLAWTL